MEGLVDEGAELMKKDADPVVMDAGLIAAAQRVEHYEMAGYGCPNLRPGLGRDQGRHIAAEDSRRRGHSRQETDPDREANQRGSRGRRGKSGAGSAKWSDCN